jgi:uridine kinase
VSENRLGDLVSAVVRSRPPAGMTTRIVAVDGLGGSGKSTLAAHLAAELGAAVVHTDDFASWDDPVDWWPDLLARVLEPLAAGEPARFRPASWGGPERDPIVVEPAEFVVLEGVTASRTAFRPYLAYAIWVETPRELRLARGLERDGEDALAQWQDWLAAEDRYVERERPAERADVVLRGDLDLWR